MKRKIKIFLIITLLLVEVCTIHLAVKSYNSKAQELPQVKLKESKKQFALMVEQTKGEGDYEDGSATYPDSFPGEGFKLNEDMSGCTDVDGKTIEGALSYDIDTYTLTVNTNKTAYCYLYYDIYEKEKTTKEILQENAGESLTTELVGDMHRYQGENDVPNWICFGTRNQDQCKSEYDKYMYRIIGVTDEGQMYLLKETFLKEESVTGFAWNNKSSISNSSSYYCPDGNCPEWNESDLFKRINGTSNGTTAGADTSSSTKSDTDIFVDNEYYDYLKSGDENGGEEASDWYNLIDNHDWYYGDTTTSSYDGNTLYNIETGKSETTHYAGTYGSVTSQNYTWTNKVNAKISLMYLHDYAYAYPGGNPSTTTNVKNSWIFFQKDGYNSSPNYEWLSTRWGIFSTSSPDVHAWRVYTDGALYGHRGLHAGYGVRPVFYLTSEARITGGDGTQSLPYILG